jgi:drug/metabolite transporter (DMT)-like permease
LVWPWAVYAALLYGYIGAVQFLPVNRVVLIFFIHPLLVSFIVMYRGKEGVTATAVTASVVALIGLVLAIGLSADNSDPRGIGLAAVAMVAAAIYILGNASAVREASSLAVAFYMMLSAAVTLSILFAVFGQTALPTTVLSWIGFVGVAFGATIGTITFISGMAHIGAARAAMISSVEPVLGVLFAVAVLGERVTLVQAGGIIMVFAAIATMEFSRREA